MATKTDSQISLASAETKAPALPDADEFLGRILERRKELHLELELYSHVLANSDLNYERAAASTSFLSFLAF